MKKYIVTLPTEDRQALQELRSAGKAAVQRLAHARILLKADAAKGGPVWTDRRSLRLGRSPRRFGMTIEESWERIRAWAAVNMPAAAFTLADPATAEQIATAEAALGLSLPADVRESYRLHNGTRDWSLPHSCDMIPVDALAAWYASQRDIFQYYEKTSSVSAEMVEGPIKPIRWTHKRIPIGDNGGGDGMQIDLDPAEGGTVGQVIWFDHEYGPRRVLAPNWAAFLAQVVADCDAGLYYFDDEEEQPWARHDEDE